MPNSQSGAPALPCFTIKRTGFFCCKPTITSCHVPVIKTSVSIYATMISDKSHSLRSVLTNFFACFCSPSQSFSLRYLAASSFSLFTSSPNDFGLSVGSKKTNDRPASRQSSLNFFLHVRPLSFAKFIGPDR